MAVDFDALNRATREFKNNEPVDRFRGCGLSAREQIALANNDTFLAHNCNYPDRPYGRNGYTYSTGRQEREIHTQ